MTVDTRPIVPNSTPSMTYTLRFMPALMFWPFALYASRRSVAPSLFAIESLHIGQADADALDTASVRMSRSRFIRVHTSSVCTRRRQPRGQLVQHPID